MNTFHHRPAPLLTTLLVVALIAACGPAQARVTKHPSPSPSPSPIESPSPTPTDVPSPTQPPAPPLAAPLPGPLPGQSLPLSGPLAYPLLIQVENTGPARPQAGFASASVVFQYLVEGGITRMSALFHRAPGVVGPVRSARFVSVYLFQRTGSLQMASGSSGWTYDKITASGIPAIINDFDHGVHFFRWNGRAAPHNLYTSQAQMIAAASVNGRPPKADDFLRSDAWAGTTAASSISVPDDHLVFNFSGDTYDVISDGSEEIDVEAGVVRPRSVAVMHVRQWITNLCQEEHGCQRDYDLSGSGLTELYAHGTQIAARWSSADGPNGAIRFIDGAGAVIGMPPGLMWVVLAP